MLEKQQKISKLTLAIVHIFIAEFLAADCLI